MLDNSFEALDHTGKLTISTRQIQKVHFEKESTQVDYAQIEIADTGYGIPKEKQGKILEPFFTTKKNGTGLGLTIVKKVIDDHHGTFEINSKEDIGTSIFITLPLNQ